METLKVTKELEIKNAIKLTDDRYLKISQDSHYVSNDDEGQLSNVVYKGGSRYNLGNKPNRHDSYANDHREAMLSYFACEYMGKNTDEVSTIAKFNTVQKWVEKNVIWLPVYAYVHSGATISTEPFSCPWDSGTSGFVYALKSKIREARGLKRLTKKTIEQETEYLKGHVGYINDLLQGNVYGYEVVDSDDDHVDSCWGFVGELNREQAMNIAAHISIEGVTDEQIADAVEYIAENDLIIY